jgi:hypothetical protein
MIILDSLLKFNFFPSGEVQENLSLFRSVKHKQQWHCQPALASKQTRTRWPPRSKWAIRALCPEGWLENLAMAGLSSPFPRRRATLNSRALTSIPANVSTSVSGMLNLANLD